MTNLLDAKPLNELFVGRRPVFDRDLQVDAYELTYRHDPGVSSEDKATAIARHVGVGDIGELTGGRPVWLRVTRDALSSKALAGADPKGLVLEVGLDLLGDEGHRAQLQGLHDEGARIAVRDGYPTPIQSNLPSLVDLVRVDAAKVDPVDLTGRLRSVRAAGAKVMAENVETHERRDFLAEAGVDLFQGVFLTQPAELRDSVPGSKLATLRLIAALDGPEVSIDEIEQIVSQDVSLSYQILRYVNSAFVGLRSQVSSIRQAVVLLGPPTVRQIAAVALMSGDDSKPAELTRTALVRAKLCEGIARSLKESPSSFYTAGLFSALDALTDVSIEKVLEELPLTDEVRAAIIDRTGTIGRAIRTAIAYERCDWDDPVFEFFDQDVLSNAYFTAITWVDETLQAISQG